MSKVLPPKKAPEFFHRLVRRTGKIETFRRLGTNAPDPWVMFDFHGRRADSRMGLALDPDDKISGLFFQPPPKPLRTIGWFVGQIFGWQHLVWIVPFFLGGLLYSWLIQKATNRAVGISSLGIHLHRGQILLLWDEVRDVRPVKILNIRSLWLIRDNGAKTIMPWTSLERRRELIAAVESSAPANHPIRKSLALLK